MEKGAQSSDALNLPLKFTSAAGLSSIIEADV